MESTTAFEALHERVGSWMDGSPQSWELFSSLFTVRRFSRHEHLLLPGDGIHRLYFVAEGLLRVYTVTPNERESNKAFFSEGTLTGPMGSYILGLTARYAVQTLEPSVILMARYDDFFQLLERHPELERFGRRYMQTQVVEKERRERISYLVSAADRYRAFAETFPEYVDRVPQYHIASMIGITPESLSRILSPA